MSKVMDWLTANKLALNIAKTKYIFITNKHVSPGFFELMQTVIVLKELILTNKRPWCNKKHCKQLCCAISKLIL